MQKNTNNMKYTNKACAHSYTNTYTHAHAYLLCVCGHTHTVHAYT